MKYQILFKKILRPFVPHIFLEIKKERRIKKQIEEWKKQGSPVPPPHMVKQITLRDYQQQYGYSTLIESGTYFGDMVEAQKNRFKKIISIELGSDLFKKAQNKFKNDKNVILVQGDSGKVLPFILKDINEPVIFWLDGHYSAGITARGDKDCPIYEELDAIFNNQRFKHILIIDDARCFLGDGITPSISELIEYVKNKDKRYQIEIKDDMIRLTI